MTRFFISLGMWPAGRVGVETRLLAGAGEGVADGAHVFTDTADGVAGGEDNGSGEEQEQVEKGFHGRILRWAVWRGAGLRAKGWLLIWLMQRPENFKRV